LHLVSGKQIKITRSSLVKKSSQDKHTHKICVTDNFKIMTGPIEIFELLCHAMMQLFFDAKMQ